MKKKILSLAEKFLRISELSVENLSTLDISKLSTEEKISLYKKLTDQKIKSTINLGKIINE